MNHYTITQNQQAASFSSHGFLFLFVLPPLTVVLMGILAFGQVTIAETAPLPTPTHLAVQTQKVQESGDLPREELVGLFTPEVLFWEENILLWSEQYGLDPNLVATVMQIESCGDPQARSGAGAMGLFQVMPYHFAVGENAYQPATNARRGLGYLQQALKKGGSIRMAFAGYNGGINGAQQGDAYWPAETQRYVYWGVGIYKAAQAGDTHSSRLDEWLASGGASLCRQAASRQGSE